MPSSTILLLEAGAPADDALLFDRYSAFRAGDGTNWGYQTSAQEELGGRVVDYSRGKGESSYASEFMFLFVGSGENWRGFELNRVKLGRVEFSWGGELC